MEQFQNIEVSELIGAGFFILIVGFMIWRVVGTFFKKK